VPAESVTGPLAVIMVPEPETVSAPPVIDKLPVIVDAVGELDETVKVPPVIDSGSLAVSELTAWPPESIVTVGVAPLTSITTSSLGPGTESVLQLVGSFQEPLLLLVQLTVARS
jgi:hypothetical protein